MVVLKYKLVDYSIINNMADPILELGKDQWDVDPNLGMALAHELGHTLGADHSYRFKGDCKYMFDFGLWTRCNRRKVDSLTEGFDKCFYS